MATGRIIKRNGKWAYVISLPYDPDTGKYPQRWRSGFETKKAADDAMRKDIALLDAGEVDHASITLEEYLHEWLGTVGNLRAPRTSETYRYTIERWIIPQLGDVKLSKLDHRKIERMYRSIAAEGIAPSSVHRVHRVLRAALNRAVKRGLLSKSPMDQVDAPSNKIDRRETLSPDHAVRLLAYFDDRSPMMRMAAYLAIYTGMRRGELCGLTWGDVDWAHGVLRVIQSRQRRDGKDLVGGTKTAGSTRPIVVDDAVMSEVKKWRSFHEHHAQSRGLSLLSSDYVLRHLDGTVPDPATLSKDLLKAVRALELPRISFHDLRHTHATLLLQANVPLKVVSERLGHASIGTTANVYAHVTENMQRQAADKLGDILRNISDK